MQRLKSGNPDNSIEINTAEFITGPQAILPEHAPRDEAAKQEEKRGLIEFHCVSNSLTD